MRRRGRCVSSGKTANWTSPHERTLLLTRVYSLCDFELVAYHSSDNAVPTRTCTQEIIESLVCIFKIYVLYNMVKLGGPDLIK